MLGSTWREGRTVLMISLILCIMFSGCSTDSNTTVPRKEEGAGSTAVTLEWWSSASLGLVEEEEFQQVLAEYKKVAPHVTINFSSVPTTGLDEKLNVAIASGSFPDLYVDAVNRLVPLFTRGVTTELDAYITEDYNLSDYMNSAKDLMTIDGKMAMILMEIRSEVLLINKDLFIKAGAEHLLPDSKTKTWSRDSFAKAVEAVGKLGNGVYGLGMVAGDVAYDKFVDGYIYSDGDEYTNKDYTKITYNSPGNVKKLEGLIQLSSSPYAVPGAAGNKIPNLYELFKQGKVGIMMNDRGDLRREINDGIIPKKFEFMNAYYPTDDGSKSKLFVNGSGIAVKKQEDKVKEKEAAKFALWFSSGKSEIVNKLIYQKYSKLPSRKSLQALVTDSQGKEWAAMPEQAINNPAAIPNYQQIRKVWFNYFQQAMLNNGKMTAKDALAGYEKEAQKLLDEGNK
ncbi:ABC transporter substrate-binding protein [Paenibacillus radicis (ex Xue et al. 2023)]|uniref:Sugar ABC transporter substrate-binding protein n=1 Tax=Paenibacillus radicis (ex Xue et al. 2023) TaxID=2972489 RepID=A0ABT1YA05_9BACL|nr:sugar ABC transporter substrate-binding protein [Paenibacillus radicis (ex Xue et al. 2023)]MCR8630023.1 sugar ABC transporter substrate-binding protein [Paenibacillus radicis (ex Xue et al. 2023)]